MKTLKTKHTKWNLNLLYKNDDDPQIQLDLEKAKDETLGFAKKWKNDQSYLESPAKLLIALEEYEKWADKFGTEGNAGYYFYLRSQLDKRDNNVKAKLGKINDSSTKLANELEFFMHSISKIPQHKQNEFLSYEPLGKYRHFLERSFLDAKFLLTEPEEKILNIVSSTSRSNWVDMVSTLISKEKTRLTNEDGKSFIASFEETLSKLSSNNKKVRDLAAKKVNRILAKHLDVAEAELNSILLFKKNIDELRNCTRPDLFRHMSDDVESEVVDALVDRVSRRFEISREYYKLKAQLMGQEKLEYHERNVPFGELNKKYSYEESLNMVYNTFDKLDSEFANFLELYNEKGQIDVFPQNGKSGGGFCISVGANVPVYVLLNHTDKINDVLTLAHEMGHAINYELTQRSQSPINTGTPLSTAEVASTFMEDFVLEELENHTDDELRLAIMMMKLNDDVSSIFRQVACYMFETELHKNFREKMHLSKKEIGNLFKKHMHNYMGEHVIQSRGSENWWVYWSHIRSFFYVYSYASGLLISKSLQNRVKKDKSFITKVKNFLSAGSHKSPKEIFSDLNIDITKPDFWDNGLDEIENLLNKARELAIKLKKI